MCRSIHLFYIFLLINLCCRDVFFFLRIRRPPRSTLTDTLFPYTTLFRSTVVVRWNCLPALASRSFAAPLPSSGSGWTLRPSLIGWFASSSFRRSEEHTSELQSLMRISYAVFCLKKKIKTKKLQRLHTNTL